MGNYDVKLLSYFDNMKRQLQVRPLILGGTSGGTGGPPGGFIGYLPQNQVSYDSIEAEQLGYVESGAINASGVLVSGSLLDNMNHIRYRLSVLEASGVGGASNLIIEDDTVVVSSGVTVINFEGGASVVEDSPGQVTVTVSGGGSNIWSPLAPPASANSNDDEFNNGSLSGNWTTLDNNTNLSVTEQDWGLVLVDSNPGSNEWMGVFKATDFVGSKLTTITKVGINGYQTGSFKAALIFGEDLTSNPTTSDILAAGVVLDGGGFGVQIEEWTAYNGSVGTSHLNDSSWNFRPWENMYIRIRWLSTTTFMIDISLDGHTWLGKSTTPYTCGFAPAEMGVGIKTSNSTDCNAVFSFFRVTNNDSILEPLRGKRI